MDPFGSHIQSMAASSLAAECTAHVRPRPDFKPTLMGGGKAGGQVLSNVTSGINSRRIIMM